MPRIWPCRLEKGGTILHPCLTLGPTPPPLDLDHHLHAGEISTSTRSSRSCKSLRPNLPSAPRLVANPRPQPRRPPPGRLSLYRSPPPHPFGRRPPPPPVRRFGRGFGGGAPRQRRAGPVPGRRSSRADLSCSNGLDPPRPSPPPSGPSVSYPFRRDDRRPVLRLVVTQRPGDPATGRPSGARAAPRRVPGGPGTGAGDGPWSGVEEGTIRRSDDELGTSETTAPGWTRCPQMKAGPGTGAGRAPAIRRCDAKRRAAGVGASGRRGDTVRRGERAATRTHSRCEAFRFRPGRTMAAAPRTGRAEPAERRARGTPATGVSAVKLPMTVRQESHRRAVRGDRDGGAEGHLATMPTCQQSGLLVKGKASKGARAATRAFACPFGLWYLAKRTPARRKIR